MDEVGEYTLQVMKKAHWYNGWLLNHFEKYLKGEILEAGCGSGNFSEILARYGKLTSIDINIGYIKKLKQKNNNIEFGYGDIEKGKYFFSSKKFDAIVSLNVLEHVKNDDRALTNLYSLTKPGGKFILLVPAHKILYGNFDTLLGHHRRYSISDLQNKLVKVGFKVENIQYLNWWGAFGWWIFIKLLKRKKFPSGEVGIFNTLGKFLLWPEQYIRFPFGLSVMAIVSK